MLQARQVFPGRAFYFAAPLRRTRSEGFRPTPEWNALPGIPSPTNSSIIETFRNRGFRCAHRMENSEIDEAGRLLTLHAEAGTFPNWNGGDQKRSLTLVGDEMKWSNRTPAIGAEVVEVAWRRAP